MLERDANVDSRDTTWNSTPLVWATVGRDETEDERAGDWVETSRVLIEHGAQEEHEA